MTGTEKRLMDVCGKGIYNNIPVNDIEVFDITHDRKIENGELSSKGGHTVCSVKIRNKEYIGIAFCSKEDNFCKKTGRTIAMKRAFQHYWSFIKACANDQIINQVYNTEY